MSFILAQCSCICAVKHVCADSRVDWASGGLPLTHGGQIQPLANFIGQLWPAWRIRKVDQGRIRKGKGGPRGGLGSGGGWDQPLIGRPYPTPLPELAGLKSVPGLLRSVPTPAYLDLRQ